MILEKTSYPATTYYLLNSWDMTDSAWLSHYSTMLFALMAYACSDVRDVVTVLEAES
jgi:hypothetical protein